MGAFDGLSNYFHGRNYLIQLAEDYQYNNSDILILEGDEQGLRDNYIDVYQNLCNCLHNRDNRSPIEYGQDLVASWLNEDYFLNELRNDDLDIQLNGADRNRDILPNARITSNSVYRLTNTITGNSRLMELMNDYSPFMVRNSALDLRDNKYSSLNNNKSLLLAVSIDTSPKYALFDFNNNIPATYIKSHRPYGGKPAYQVNVEKNSLHNFSIEAIRNQLLGII